MRKKRLVIFFIMLLFVITAARFISYRSDDRGEWEISEIMEEVQENCPRYSMRVDFLPEEKKINALLEIEITNYFGKELTHLYFHIYPNAFKNYDSVPFPKSELSKAYPDGFSPGYAVIKNVKVNSAQTDFKVDDTILKIDLKQPLKINEKLYLTVEFEAVIPPSRGRYGYGPNTYNIANWYPILAVYDETGWHTDPYYPIGDPFYSDVAIYKVEIAAPREFTIAATGNLEKKWDEGDKTIWSFNTKPVRDFAWIASEKFETVKANVGKTQITSYYLKGYKDYGMKALECGKKAIEIFNDYFGEYPYQHYSIVASDFYIGGMEYPNLVMIGTEFYGPGDFLEYIVVHETAHQWWYNLVGNNQIEEAWLDEALTEYSTIVYYEKAYGQKIGSQVFRQVILTPYKLYEVSNRPGPILRPLSDFIDWMEYSAVVYNKGAIMLKELESRMGKVKLQEALRHYLRQNMYKNAGTGDFIDALNKVSGTDWTDFLLKWLKDTESLENAA